MLISQHMKQWLTKGKFVPFVAVHFAKVLKLQIFQSIPSAAGYHRLP